MDKDDFLRQEYLTLRAEIYASKARCFWILVVGIILVMVAAYFAAVQPGFFANAAIPLVLLVLLLAFAAEQNGIIRAGRFIRQHIEPKGESIVGWERWLESNPAYREVDRFFVGGFIAVFLAFFAISCSLSLSQLDELPSTVFSRCAATAHGLGLLALLLVLFRHWKTLMTAPNQGNEAEA